MDYKIEDLIENILTGFGGISPIDRQRLMPNIRMVSYSRNDFLARQENKNSPLAVIYSGVFRVYSLDDEGNEINISFRKKGDIIGIYSPLFSDTQKENWVSIQALADSEVILIPQENYQHLSKDNPRWLTIEKNYFLQLYLEMESRVRSLLIQDAKERYLDFHRAHRELEQQIPQFHIASYLGISPVSLSRIKKSLDPCET